MDRLGDILRDFYQKYGVKDEGPPKNINVSKLAPNLIIDSELNRIIRISNDAFSWSKFKECRSQLECVAELLYDSSDFLNEIDKTSHSFPDENDFHQMVNGNFWYYLASNVEHLPNEMAKSIKIGKLHKRLLLVQGSLVFRLYMSLVYMKEGPVITILEEAAKNRMPISLECCRFIKCDYLRHIRNSLAHASFESTIAGIYFKDRNGFETISTPGFLNLLLSWVLVINTCCLTVISNHINDT